MLTLLVIFVLSTVGVMVAFWYASKVFGWGLHHYPKTAVAIILLLALAAVASYSYLFPGCTVGLGLGHLATCA